MKKIFLALALLPGTALLAQSDSTKPQLKLSVNYNSNLHYYGRTDSFRSSGYFPMVELYITPKFYVNAAPIFVSNKFQSFNYAGTVATAGYLNVTDKWLTSIYALKPFYTSEARLVQSALKAQAGASVGRLNKVANVTLGADVKFSDAVDFGASAGLDHIFRHMLPGSGGVIVVDPTVTVNAGTQRFSTTYVKQQNGNGNGPLGLPIGNGNGNGGASTETVQSNRFNILSYEASVPVIYVRGKWMLLATPAWVSPQNLLAGEYGKDQFYVTAGLKYSF
ncbi:hypothetical protein EPD60_07710 [Flaviaesturariibacter flavus]|uniref:MipA/OmpV family protein n=1 Tax=Flaviaesturariibacter flavus TaxID=2502780 RepID=A0A4R1BFE5_9BACT|nr:hypothetical protein [Flaviaesturariibacter flavus]TCJ15837.1 hypothetical protein EPD60_07710 [Flaviaesturariibacter flavus]